MVLSFAEVNTDCMTSVSKIYQDSEDSECVQHSECTKDGGAVTSQT